MTNIIMLGDFLSLVCNHDEKQKKIHSKQQIKNVENPKRNIIDYRYNNNIEGHVFYWSISSPSNREQKLKLFN